MQTDDGQQKHILLVNVRLWFFKITLWLWPSSFDLILLIRLPAAMDYIYTNFSVNSSSRLPFRARTHRHTKAQTQLITISHILSCAGVNSWHVATVTDCHCDLTHLIWPFFILTECTSDRSQSQQTGSLYNARPSSPWSRPITAHSLQIKLEIYKHSYRHACTHMQRN